MDAHLVNAVNTAACGVNIPHHGCKHGHGRRGLGVQSQGFLQRRVQQVTVKDAKQLTMGASCVDGRLGRCTLDAQATSAVA